MIEPKVTGNATLWCKYIAELIKENGIGKCEVTDVKSTGSLHLTDVAKGNINELKLEGLTTQQTTNGYNLFDKNSITKTAILIENGTVSPITTEAGGKYSTSDFIEVKENTSYTITKTGSKRIKLYDKNKKVLSTSSFSDITGVENGGTIIIPTDCKYIRFSMQDDNIDTIQLEEGTTAHDYEPYTGAKPSPSPEYPQEVKGVDKIEGKVIGKNLFDINGSVNQLYNGVSAPRNGNTVNNEILTSTFNISGEHLGGQLINVKPNTTYTLKVKILKSSTASILIYNYNALNFALDKRNLQVGEYSFSFTPVSSTILVGFGNRNSTLQSQFTNIQVEEGTTTTNYQPYQSQPISYTLSNPLYKLSDTVYDYIDLSKGKIVRNVEVVELDGSSDENWDIIDELDTTVVYMGDLDVSSKNLAISNKLIYNSRNVEEEYFRVSSALATISINKSRLADIENETFTQWLSQNPVNVYYQRRKPIEEDIPKELLTQLQALKLYKPITNIISNVPLSFKYYSKYKELRMNLMRSRRIVK